MDEGTQFSGLIGGRNPHERNAGSQISPLTLSHHYPLQVEEEDDEVKSCMGGGGGIWLGFTEVLLV